MPRQANGQLHAAHLRVAGVLLAGDAHQQFGQVPAAHQRLFQIGETYTVDFCPDRSGAKMGFTNAFTFPDGKFIRVGFPENPNGELPAVIPPAR